MRPQYTAVVCILQYLVTQMSKAGEMVLHWAQIANVLTSTYACSYQVPQILPTHALQYSPSISVPCYRSLYHSGEGSPPERPTQCLEAQAVRQRASVPTGGRTRVHCVKTRVERCICAPVGFPIKRVLSKHLRPVIGVHTGYGKCAEKCMCSSELPHHWHLAIDRTICFRNAHALTVLSASQPFALHPKDKKDARSARDLRP